MVEYGDGLYPVGDMWGAMSPHHMNSHMFYYPPSHHPQGLLVFPPHPHYHLPPPQMPIPYAPPPPPLPPGHYYNNRHRPRSNLPPRHAHLAYKNHNGCPPPPPPLPPVPSSPHHSCHPNSGPPTPHSLAPDCEAADHAPFRRDGRKQRPSKRARQRMRKKIERLRFEQSDRRETNLISSESGYDTNGDPSSVSATNTPLHSPQKSFLVRPPKSSPPKPPTSPPKKEETSTGSGVAPAAVSGSTESLTTTSQEDPSHERSHSDSMGSLVVCDSSLKRQLKDLQRCDVSLTRYQSTLAEHCGEEVQLLEQMMDVIRGGLNDRERLMKEELNSAEKSASAILQRRKETAQCLRQAADRAHLMEAVQVTELKHQIKQFVTDRKVDEEIGSTDHLLADVDDLLPHIMGFGKVMSGQHRYTSWEADPETAIELSKRRCSLFSQVTCSSLDNNEEEEEDGLIEKSSSQESVCISNANPESESATCSPPPLAEAPTSESQGSMLTSEGWVEEKEAEQPDTQHTTSESDQRTTSESDQRTTSESDQPLITHERTLFSPLAPPPPLPKTTPSFAAGTYSRSNFAKVTASFIPISPNQTASALPPAPLGDWLTHEVPRVFATPPKGKQQKRAKLQKKSKPDKAIVADTAVSVGKKVQTIKENEIETVKEDGGAQDKEHTSSLGKPQEGKPAPPSPETSREHATPLPSPEADRKHATPPPSTDASHECSMPPALHQERAKSLPFPEAYQKLATPHPSCETHREYAPPLPFAESYLESPPSPEAQQQMYPPEKLASIQARVRASLEQQGVFLYDPFTGAGPPKGPPTLALCAAEQGDFSLKHRKTPTQLRRERKKRQRERERRQQEPRPNDSAERASDHRQSTYGHASSDSTMAKLSDSNSDAPNALKGSDEYAREQKLRKKIKSKTCAGATSQALGYCHLREAQDESESECPSSSDVEVGTTEKAGAIGDQAAATPDPPATPPCTTTATPGLPAVQPSSTLASPDLPTPPPFTSATPDPFTLQSSCSSATPDPLALQPSCSSGIPDPPAIQPSQTLTLLPSSLATPDPPALPPSSTLGPPALPPTPDPPASDSRVTPDPPASDSPATPDPPASDSRVTPDPPASDSPATPDPPASDSRVTPDPLARPLSNSPPPGPPALPASSSATPNSLPPSPLDPLSLLPSSLTTPGPLPAATLDASPPLGVPGPLLSKEEGFPDRTTPSPSNPSFPHPLTAISAPSTKDASACSTDRPSLVSDEDSLPQTAAEDASASSTDHPSIVPEEESLPQTAAEDAEDTSASSADRPSLVSEDESLPSAEDTSANSTDRPSIVPEVESHPQTSGPPPATPSADKGDGSAEVMAAEERREHTAVYEVAMPAEAALNSAVKRETDNATF